MSQVAYPTGGEAALARQSFQTALITNASQIFEGSSFLQTYSASGAQAALLFMFILYLFVFIITILNGL